MAMLLGWVKSALQGLPRYPDLEFRKFLRHYQMRALLVGKKRATEEVSASRRQTINARKP
jgi:hypothetical protein